MSTRIPATVLPLLLVAGLAGCASNNQPTSARDAMAASESRRQQEAVVVYPARCYEGSRDPACPKSPANPGQGRRPAPAGGPMSGSGLPMPMSLPGGRGGIGGLGR